MQVIKQLRKYAKAKSIDQILTAVALYSKI